MVVATPAIKIDISMQYCGTWVFAALTCLRKDVDGRVVIPLGLLLFIHRVNRLCHLRESIPTKRQVLP